MRVPPLSPPRHKQTSCARGLVWGLLLWPPPLNSPYPSGPAGPGSVPSAPSCCLASLHSESVWDTPITLKHPQATMSTGAKAPHPSTASHKQHPTHSQEAHPLTQNTPSHPLSQATPSHPLTQATPSQPGHTFSPSYPGHTLTPSHPGHILTPSYPGRTLSPRSHPGPWTLPCPTWFPAVAPASPGQPFSVSCTPQMTSWMHRHMGTHTDTHTDTHGHTPECTQTWTQSHRHVCGQHTGTTTRTQKAPPAQPTP